MGLAKVPTSTGSFVPVLIEHLILVMEAKCVASGSTFSGNTNGMRNEYSPFANVIGSNQVTFRSNFDPPSTCQESHLRKQSSSAQLRHVTGKESLGIQRAHLRDVEPEKLGVVSARVTNFSVWAPSGAIAGSFIPRHHCCSVKSTMAHVNLHT
jgi:hypothetical protein